ncbi:MAG: DHHA1 domain-containing protein [Candidatus Caldatribacteriota bacterium]|nr:DHHA1 domain-containing protein [Candidatus Caldatribacteriota bacterium]
MNKRLYYKYPYLKEFKGKILEKVRIKDKPVIVLDNTCFYPTSGGQPNDLGYIQSVPVIDVIEDKEKIVHVLKEDIEEKSGDTIIGKIDWVRRFDHMQQHSGQHILSAAFEKLWDADTVSFNLGDEICSIDIMKDNITSEEIKKVEELANNIVLRNLSIEVYFAEREDAGKLNLRKLPPQKGKIRIVEIKDFDICACCGTHCSNSGEVGLIKILKWENKGVKIRIDFICGKRSLKDYFWKNELIRNISNKLTIKDSELGEVMERILEERKGTGKKLREYKEKLQEYEASKLINKSVLNDNGIKIINKIFEQECFQEVRELVQKSINLDDSIVVLAGIKNKREGAKILLACSKALKYDMNKLIREAEKFIEGRGGGAPNFAQAGGKNAEGIEDALNFALEHFQEFVKK